MYAIIETGGKQYKVEENVEFRTEKIGEVTEGDQVKFDRVLMISESDQDGKGKTDFGKPYLKGAKVKAKVVNQGRGEKITIFKYKKRKRYRRKMGHRQPYMKLQVTEIIR